MRRAENQIVATWILGGLTFLFVVSVFVFAPDELSRYKHRILSLICSVLAGFFAYFLSGTVGVSAKPRLPLVGEISVRATGGLAIFAMTLLWWSSDFAPVKVQKRTGVVSLVSDEDIHLGDNVYPERWGFSHNPLNVDIYQQEAKGLIYFDKESGRFLAGSDKQTVIGQGFVSFYEPKLRALDFSGYKFVSAHEESDPMPALLKRYIEARDERRFVRLGPTTLYTNDDNKGNFYNRYAAVAVVRPIDFTIPLAKAGLEFVEHKVGEVEFIIECYHGGIRPGQSQNFALFLNGKAQEIRTTSSNMREKEVVRMAVPTRDLSFKERNVAGLFVLPWQEDRPASSTTDRGPVHFRDVGVVNAYFVVTER